MFRLYLYKFGQFCVLRMSLPLAYRVAGWLSRVHYYLHFRDRRAVKNNLKAILQTEEDVSRLAKEVFKNFGKYLVDFFRMRKTLNKNYVKNRIKIENLRRVQEVLRKGKGGIILAAHIGNWELGAAVMSFLGYSLVAIALPHKERPVNDLFNIQREIWGITVIPTNGTIRKCLEALKENKLVALLADRAFGMHGEPVPFLNKTALIPKGAAVFSVKTGAPILPVFLLRNDDDSFTMIFEEPIFPPSLHPEAVPDDVLSAVVKQYTRVMEQKIREYPTQWLMFREFWIK